jgi:hypothetical protein
MMPGSPLAVGLLKRDRARLQERTSIGLVLIPLIWIKGVEPGWGVARSAAEDVRGWDVIDLDFNYFNDSIKVREIISNYHQLIRGYWCVLRSKLSKQRCANILTGQVFGVAGWPFGCTVAPFCS